MLLRTNIYAENTPSQGVKQLRLIIESAKTDF